MRLDGSTNRRVATKLVIGHLSGVNVPAHEQATVKVIKMAPLLKSVFTAALAERQLSQQVSEMLDKAWPLNCALREASEAIAEDDMIVDKQAALMQTVNEYITAMQTVMLGTPVAKAAPMKTEGGTAYPASDFAYVPDAAKPSEWKLRLTSTPGGDPDPAIVGAAAAALGPGYRGQKVELPEADRAAVVARVRAAWTKANLDKKPEDMPVGIQKQQESQMDELAKYKALAEMTDVQKAHYSTLPTSEQETYLAMPADERQAVADVCKQADESFTADDGTVVAKSAVGPAAYAVMKSQNAQLVKMRDEMQMTEFAKRAADELQYLPGEQVAKAQVLKHIDTMPVMAKTCLTQMLKAANDASKPGFKPAAVAGTPPADQTAQEKLDAMAAAEAAKKGCTVAKAYAGVLQTEEGKKLYEEIGNGN